MIRTCFKSSNTIEKDIRLDVETVWEIYVFIRLQNYLFDRVHSHCKRATSVRHHTHLTHVQIVRAMHIYADIHGITFARG